MAAKDAVDFIIEDHGDKVPLKGFRKDAQPVPEVAEAYAAGDEFTVDYVRVYDIVR